MGARAHYTSINLTENNRRSPKSGVRLSRQHNLFTTWLSVGVGRGEVLRVIGGWAKRLAGNRACSVGPGMSENADERRDASECIPPSASWDLINKAKGSGGWVNALALSCPRQCVSRSFPRWVRQVWYMQKSNEWMTNGWEGIFPKI